MPCKYCGSPTKVVASTGGIKSGEFTERYECTQGHIGHIRGDAGSPESWRRTGAVFNAETY